ncbi:NAD(P)/FAD-dependent oxidoreductase [Streptosporangium sp. NPDC023825]|uniref:FAD-dependent oxidoreductase n=1 Tax=Streptosporangium sp. NPDC023825 TaxID=3154909 RepID=UPI00343E66C6
MTNSRVAVVGGGIGGLCLAQGLRGAGVDVTVYERDRTPSDRLQGYRVHIDPDGSRALRDCLPPELWEAFLATSGRDAQDFRFLSHRMRPLLTLESRPVADPVDAHHSVSRITLRQVLLSGLDGPSGVVRFGKTFESYTRDPGGTITLRFADGTTETAGIVVAADGGNSRVRHQYLPHARRVDTGIITLAGKFPLTAATRALVDPALYEAVNMIIPPRGLGMFTAPHDLGGAGNAGNAGNAGSTVLPSGIGRTEREGALFDNTAGYVMWAFGAATGRFPGDLAAMDGERLRDTVARMITGWHPDLRTLVTTSDPATVSLLPIRTSVPIGPWPATNITLLGDAIHSMTPMRGIGANVALRDARSLCRALTGALGGGGDPVAAIAAYEAEMREYGFAAVRDSLRAARQFVDENPVARAGFRTFLRTAQRLPALRHRAFS